MENQDLYRRNEEDLKFTIAQAKIGGGNMTKISQVSLKLSISINTDNITQKHIFF